MLVFTQKLSKSNPTFVLIVLLMGLLFAFTRREWYRKKRFVIPMVSFIVLLIGAIILAAVLSTRTHINRTGTIFDIFSVQSRILIML